MKRRRYLRPPLILFVLSVATAACAPQEPDPRAVAKAAGGKPTAIVLMIGDGFGLDHFGLLHEYRRVMKGDRVRIEVIQERPETVFGLLRTAAARTVVTDSAAAATAMACGQKTMNGKIAMDPDDVALETVLERAVAARWRTALVTTSRITHATPACFATHVVKRTEERQIARQMATAAKADLLLGGGSVYFTAKGKTVRDHLGPEAFGGEAVETVQIDDADLFAVAREVGGYTVVGTLAELRAAPVEARLLGVFAPKDLPYEIDRQESNAASVPTLAEMTREALTRSAQAGAPFFAMIEGGRIDHAAHQNDVGAMLHEMLAFDDAVGIVDDFIRAGTHDVTLIITADHATGGFAIGYPQSNANLGVAAELSWLDHQAVSFEWIGKTMDPATLDSEVQEAVKKHLGLQITAAELALFTSVKTAGSPAEVAFMPARGIAWTAVLGQIVARRTGFIWSTGGHTGPPVPVWATGPGAAGFRGVNENTRVAEVVFGLIGEAR